MFAVLCCGSLYGHSTTGTNRSVKPRESGHEATAGRHSAVEEEHVGRISLGGGRRDYNHAAWGLALKRRWTTVQMDVTAEWRMERKAVVKLDGEESTRKWSTP